MRGYSISTMILPFKILFQYGLVNTDIVTPLFSLWHKTILTVCYRPRLVPNLSRRQTCAPAKAIKTPARPLMVCLYREGYQYKRQKKKKFIKKTQWDSERKGAKSHTDMLPLRAHYLFFRKRQTRAVGHLSLKVYTEALYFVFHIKQSTAYVCCLLRYRISTAVSNFGLIQGAYSASEPM